MASSFIDYSHIDILGESIEQCLNDMYSNLLLLRWQRVQNLALFRSIFYAHGTRSRKTTGRKNSSRGAAVIIFSPCFSCSGVSEADQKTPPRNQVSTKGRITSSWLDLSVWGTPVVFEWIYIIFMLDQRYWKKEMSKLSMWNVQIWDTWKLLSTVS